MGNYLDLPLATLSELQRETALLLTYKGKLGGSSFLRTLLCLHSEHGLVVVKVYSIRQKDRDEASGQPKAVSAAKAKMETLAARLTDARSPHVCLYRHFEFSASLAYMVRPYIYASLHERLMMRPFLAHEEKRWLAFQVLTGVDLAHRSGVRHGDFKTENILVTSWNWVLLSDFAPYKPVYIDITNTADFTYYFDTGGRRRCYLAPERFQEPASLNLGLSQAELTPAMDVFSVGCVIAELLTDEPLFKLSDLIAYRREDVMTGHTKACLAKLQSVSPEVADLVRHMTQLDPKARWSIHAYLHHWPVAIFPPYFPAMHRALAPLLHLEADARVRLLQRAFPGLRDLLSGAPPPRPSPGGAAERPALVDGRAGGADADDAVPLTGAEATATPPDRPPAASGTHLSGTGTGSELRGDADLSAAAGASTSVYVGGSSAAPECQGCAGDRPSGTGPSAQAAGSGASESGEGRQQPEASSSSVTGAPAHASMTLLAVVLCSLLRGAVTQDARWAALRMLLTIAPSCTDDCKLQRIVPYLLALVVDQAATVQRKSAPLEADSMTRMLALRHIIVILRQLRRLPRSDRGLFVEYLLPALSTLPTRGEELKREYARCLPLLAFCALALHEASLAPAPSTALDAPQADASAQMALHHSELRRLRRTMQAVIQEHFQPERARDVWLELLQSGGSLAAFFGPHITNSVLLPSMLWLPNEPNWQVRAAFYRHLPDVAAHVGVFTLTNVFIPVMEATLRHKEEPPDVVLHALQALTVILKADLAPHATLFAPNGVAAHALAKLQHPSAAVRAAALHFLQAAAQRLQLPEVFALVAPVVSAVTGHDAHGCHLSPLLYSQPLLVAEHIKYQRPVAVPPPLAFFPHSRIAFVQAAVDSASPGGGGGTAYNAPLLVEPSSGGLAVLCAPADDPLRWPGESLHTQALRSANVPLPGAPPPDAEGRSAQDGGETQMDLSPACPAAHYTRQLLQVSQLKSSMEPGSPTVDAPGGARALGSALQAGLPPGPGDFEPRGVLVAHLAEHQHCVNKLTVCHATPFFASASSDCTVKLWDRRRFDKMVSFQSRLTYSGHDCAVTAVDFVSESCIASGDASGSLHLWDIEYQGAANTRPTVALASKPPLATNDGWRRVLRLQRWGPLIVLLTERGGVRGFDQRAMRPVWTLPMAPCDGVGTAMALMPDGTPAMCTATHRGLVQLWDLRFLVKVDSWAHPSGEPIHDIAIPTATPQDLGLRSYGGAAPLLYVAAGKHEVSCWDLDSFRCRQVLLANQQRASAGGQDEALLPTALGRSRRGERSTAGHDALLTGAASPVMRSLLPLPSGALLTAGSDKCIRYWRMKHPNQSYIVCGPLKDASAGVSTLRSQPSARSSGVSYVHQAYGDVGLLTEVHTRTGPLVGEGGPQGGAVVSEMRAKCRVESLCHRDCIQDLAIANVLDPVLLSASRDGIIKAWR